MTFSTRSAAAQPPQPHARGDEPDELFADLGDELAVDARASEIERVKEHLRLSRMLTLISSGGCGRTRLGLEVARGSSRGDLFRGGWLVELAPLAESAE